MKLRPCPNIWHPGKEGNVLFNDALKTFYLRLYGDHSDSERGNPLPPHGLLFPISSKCSFICTIPQHRIAHTTAFVAPVVEHWLELEITQWVQHECHPGKAWNDARTNRLGFGSDSNQCLDAVHHQGCGTPSRMRYTIKDAVHHQGFNNAIWAIGPALEEVCTLRMQYLFYLNTLREYCSRI